MYIILEFGVKRFYIIIEFGVIRFYIIIELKVRMLLLVELNYLKKSVLEIKSGFLVDYNQIFLR